MFRDIFDDNPFSAMTLYDPDPPDASAMLQAQYDQELLDPMYAPQLDQQQQYQQSQGYAPIHDCNYDYDYFLFPLQQQQQQPQQQPGQAQPQPQPQQPQAVVSNGALPAPPALAAANTAATTQQHRQHQHQHQQQHHQQPQQHGPSSGQTGGHLVPNYSVYPGMTPSNIANMKVHNNTPGFMASCDIRMEILKQQMIYMMYADPETHPDLPSEVDNFAQLCPLEASTRVHNKSTSFGCVTSVYKATNMKNAAVVCLRRIHNFRLVNTKCMALVDQWKKLSHANLVTLQQVFTTKTFGDHSMVFVYDFYPNAETIMDKHFSQTQSQMQAAFSDPFSGTDGTAQPYSQHKNKILRQQVLLNQNGYLPESLIWTYVIQLTSVIRQVHVNGLACRTLDPTKILVIQKSRLLLNCGGIFDVLTFDANSPNPLTSMNHYQQEDLIALGKIILSLACNSFMATQCENLQASMEIVMSTYSQDLRNVIMYLLTSPSHAKSVNDLMPMIGVRFYTQLDTLYLRIDQVETELAKDIESTRLFRLLTKLCTIVDRGELNGDSAWGEVGDRFMLKLFKDYVFHQVMKDGRPWLDMAHVITCLNKLDAGVTERICLMTHDSQNVLVVSYAELKNNLEESFRQCLHAQRTPPAAAAAVSATGHPHHPHDHANNRQMSTY